MKEYVMRLLAVFSLAAALFVCPLTCSAQTSLAGEDLQEPLLELFPLARGSLGPLPSSWYDLLQSWYCEQGEDAPPLSDEWIQEQTFKD